MRPLTCVVLAACLAPAMADEPRNPYLEYIQGRAAAMRAGDTSPASLDAWNAQRGALQARMREAWGGFPEEACPLDPRVLGVLERDGYRVERLLFQTLPDLWMTANAYVPEQPGPRPAVLCVHGHWAGAKQDPHVQARCIGLAKLGYFVLAVDALGAGERAVGKALGEYHGDMVAGALFPLGRPLSGLQVYENGRAVDYMLTRPEVDGARLGITGASGGGNQSMYAGAWDTRFKAVVPVCSVGNYQAYLGAACCLCEVVPGALRFTEEWGVLGLTAPRALMVVNATQDAHQFSVDEAKESLAFVDPIYQLYGQPENLRHAVFESGHDYSQPMREAMYGWMALHLKGEGDGSPVPEPAMVLEDPEGLRCFPGDTRPEDWMTIPRFAAREGRKLVANLAAPATAEAWNDMARGMREGLDRIVLGGTTPAPEALVPGAPALSDSVTSAPTPEGTVLLLSFANDAGPGETELARILTESGRNVAPLHLRATGPYAVPGDAIGRAPDHNSAEWALWTGQPLLGQWVTDIRAALDRLVEGGSDPDSFGLVGIGPAGVVAVCAAAVDSRIQRAASIGALASYISEVPFEGQRLGIMAPGLVRDVGDIQHVAALVAPRKLVIAGSVTGGGEPLGAGALDEQFRFARDIYSLAQAPDNFILLPAGDTAALLDALE